jgi:hypothetical protein
MNPATKQYVDQTATGLKVRPHVSLATTGPIASFNGNIPVDSTMTTTNMRILVKDQNTKTENGVWVASAGPWTRATDFKDNDNVTGFYFFVDDGSGNLHTGWVVNGADVIVGTSEIIFSQFSTTGDIQAGKGLTKTGETLDIIACDSNGHYTLSQPTITNGTINGTTIGTNSASTGKFTDLTATGTSTLATVDISGGTIDGTTIGASSASTGKFTTLDVVGDISCSGDLSVNNNGNKFTVDSGTGNTSIAGTCTVNSTLDETGSGALVVKGGCQIYKRLFVGGDVSAPSVFYGAGLDVQGELLVQSSVNVSQGDIICDGDITATGDIISNVTSDIRFKTNINKIENPLEKISKINGYTYDWIQSDLHPYNGSDTGIIAQEVETMDLPGMVVTRSNGYKGVKYERLIPLLVESIKSLQETVAKQQEQINQLMKKIN